MTQRFWCDSFFWDQLLNSVWFDPSAYKWTGPQTSLKIHKACDTTNCKLMIKNVISLLIFSCFSLISHKPILYFQVEMMIIIHGKMTFRSYWLQSVTVGFVPSILPAIYTWNKDDYDLHSSMRKLRYRKTKYLPQGDSKFLTQFPASKDWAPGLNLLRIWILEEIFTFSKGAMSHHLDYN